MVHRVGRARRGPRLGIFEFSSSVASVLCVAAHLVSWTYALGFMVFARVAMNITFAEFRVAGDYLLFSGRPTLIPSCPHPTSVL